MEEAYEIIFSVYHSNLPKNIQNSIIFGILTNLSKNTNYEQNINIIKLVYQNIDKESIHLKNKENKIIYFIFNYALCIPELQYIIDDLFEHNIDFSDNNYQVESNISNENLIKMINNGLKLDKLKLNLLLNIYPMYELNDFQKNKILQILKHNLYNANDILLDLNSPSIEVICFFIDNNLEFDLKILETINPKSWHANENTNNMYISHLLNLLSQKNYNFTDSNLIKICATKDHYQILIDNGYDINSDHFVPEFKILIRCFMPNCMIDSEKILLMLVNDFNLDLHLMYQKSNIKNSEIFQLFEDKGLNFMKIHNSVLNEIKKFNSY